MFSAQPYLNLASDIILDDLAPLMEKEIITADEGMKSNIFTTMTIVSLSCNIFTLVLSFVMIHRLFDVMRNAKRNREKKRKKLYLYSILFVSLNFV